MKPMKRLEIVIDALAVPRLLEELERADVHDWTVIGVVSGRGDRGDRGGGDPAGAFDNQIILVICEPDWVHDITEALRPLLKTYGGMCVITDCEWLIHE